jgi:hypothetical protein
MSPVSLAQVGGHLGDRFGEMGEDQGRWAVT